MGMIEQEYKELRQLLKDLRDGKVDQQMVNTQIAIYSQMEKRQKNAIAIQALAVKANNQKPVKALINQNIIGNKTTIDMSREETEAETIRCQLNDNIITRARCLEYSGGHNDECAGCFHFGETRKKLIDDVTFIQKP